MLERSVPDGEVRPARTGCGGWRLRPRIHRSRQVSEHNYPYRPSAGSAGIMVALRDSVNGITVLLDSYTGSLRRIAWDMHTSNRRWGSRNMQQ